jgi:hypothetical protein
MEHLSAAVLLYSFFLSIPMFLIARHFALNSATIAGAFDRGSSFVSLLLVAWAATTPILYVFSYSYIDAVEPSVASVANYWLGKHDLYHGPYVADIYSMVYGPLPFLINGLFQKILPFNEIWASKIPGVCAFFASILIFEKVLLRFTTKREIWFLYLPIFLAFALCFENISYWNRPESYLLLLTSAACFVLLRKNSSKATILWTGGLAGLALATKTYAPLFLMPVFILQWESDPERRLKKLIVTATLSSLLALVIFFAFMNLPYVSLENFHYWLQFIAREAYEIKILINSLLVSGLMLAVLIYYRAYRLPGTFFTFATSLILLSLFSSKVGSHSHYLLPAVPFLLIFVAQLKRSYRPLLQPQLLYPLLAAATVCAVQSQVVVAFFISDMPVYKEQIQEVKFLMERYPGTHGIGFSDYQSYTLNFYSPLVIGQKGRLLVDRSLLWDRGANHVPMPMETLKALESCEIKNYILPTKGEPWSAIEYYEGIRQGPMFPPEWRELFQLRYRKVLELKNFSLYSCHS